MRCLTCLLLLLLLALPCAAVQGLPPYLPLPGSVELLNADALTTEEYGEAAFSLPGSDDPVIQRGKHWSAGLRITGLPEETEGKAIWARIKPALLKGGWSVPGEFDANPFSATLRYQKDGKDVWGVLTLFGTEDLRLDLIEIKPQNISLMIKPPATTPEKVGAVSGDFPYLPPLPGSAFMSGSSEDGPMLVTLQGSEEPQTVGSGSIRKHYQGPAGLSNVQFVTVYREALKQAGWMIVSESQSLNQSDAVLTAHYVSNGRDIWAYLHHGGSEYVIQVADAGAEDLNKKLAKECHVALYGIHFDFNKATLRPDSEPQLQKVLALLRTNTVLNVEVQGHTDNVGSDDYNQRLSEARAKTVMDWLVSKGIAAGRLSAKGYGKTQPVASNDDDAGRAKNRRVELARQGCAR